MYDLRSVCSPTLAKLRLSKNGVDENLTRYCTSKTGRRMVLTMQCGTVFKFGNFDPARRKLFINLNLGLRKNALINDMAAESQVRCINYELKNTSNQSLDCTSSSNVKTEKLQLSIVITVKIIARFLLRQVH